MMPLWKKKHFELLWEKLDMPDITKDINLLPEIIAQAQQWFSFLTDFRLSCIEGNHRMEFYARIALGFGIYEPAPLKKLQSPRLFPKGSTVYKAIPVQFYFQTNCSMDTQFLKAMKDHSTEIQTKKQIVIQSTWRNVLSTIAEKIYELTNGGEKAEYVLDPFEFITTHEKKNDANVEKLENIHFALISIILDVMYTLDPAKKDMKNANKEELAKLTHQKFKGISGISSHCFSNVSSKNITIISTFSY